MLKDRPMQMKYTARILNDDMVRVIELPPMTTKQQRAIEDSIDKLNRELYHAEPKTITGQGGGIGKPEWGLSCTIVPAEVY